MVQIFIDEKQYDVDDGITVIQACEIAGIEIPRKRPEERTTGLLVGT